MARHRLNAKIARDDKRDWVVKRRERTRQLIELGGLVAKAGLIDLTDDDRAVIFGILVDAAARLRGEDRDKALLLWWRRGARAFEALAPEREPRA
ncbi:conjugal transfer protein TraD [Sphingomonas sp. R647]|uniref:conjugal transfer protein TraD n=1 Tax=Sphingomonas sp. R647 TaxID=2875233 RepID=UPI001CD39D6C|nr:conjugal transfer protein TraD [Sphingomonas sp. R647]MCA1199213.1 conjugal transfer protein TraD [Sphingomonas sp. R647]